MSGRNTNMLDIPPGMSSDGTIYSTGKRWRTGSLVRWLNNILTPVGGWVKYVDLTAHVNPIRDIYSWRDYLKQPWTACGSDSVLTATKSVSGVITNYTITPAGLSSSGAPKTGFGSGGFGSGAYSQSKAYVPDATGMWSFDNFGRELVAVQSQDGRLFHWDPLTPATPAAVVVNAPTSNNLVIVTEEDFVMVLGGKQNSRQVKWCSQRNMTDWTPTETNSAGGFDLKSNGAIIAAKKVQGGILVITDSDVHIIEYSGPPNYYVRRRISEDGGIVGKNSISSIPGGAVWLSQSNFWIFDGNISKMECSVHTQVLYNSNLTDPTRVFMGVNEYAQEVWLFYPSLGQTEADSYAFFSYAKQIYWATGKLSRTAWLNPVWQSKPIMVQNKAVYAHEMGWTADGADRVVYAITGGIEIGDGDTNMWVDRIWQDNLDDVAVGSFAADPSSYTLTFGLRQAPDLNPRTVGPISMTNARGYISTRFRAREITVRIDQIKNAYWTLGKLRLRIKPGGIR